MKRFFLLALFITSVFFVGISLAISPIKTEEKNEDGDFAIGWVGDMVPASNPVFNNEAFLNVKNFTEKPTLMVGNLEGTFARDLLPSKCQYLGSKCHAFRGDISFAYALKDAGFDLVSLVNNHSYDYGDEGLSDTEAVLESMGIPYISQIQPSIVLDVNGKKVGVLGVAFTPPLSTITNYEFIKSEIEKLKEKSDLVILIFHGGAEGSDKILVPGKEEYLGTENRGNVELVSHIAIDAGADIVLGSGPHVLRKTEYYKTKPIIYSAGNFFGGNERLLTRGNLGISAIFNINVSKNYKVGITSITLSKEGVPSLDLSERGRILVESLSK